VRTAVDASVLVAGLLPWHEHHGPARTALRALLGAETVREKPVLPAHALLEAYSVMTQLPAPFRVPPAKAFALLEELTRGRVTLAQLSPDDTWRLLDRLAEAEITGGAVYDAAIANAAHRAGAQQILRARAGITAAFGRNSINPRGVALPAA
jgi:predicted nucleic acid-binding protein